MKKLAIAALSLFVLAGHSVAGEQFTAKQHMAQLKAAATPVGPYADYDRWPKDYFLVPQNLPFLVGFSLYVPGHESVGYSKEQLAAIHEIRNTTVPEVLKFAKVIKQKELELAEKLVDQRTAPKELHGLVDEIASLKAELTKAHMECIHSVQQVVPDKEQYAKLLKHARNAAKIHKKMMMKKMQQKMKEKQ